MDARKAQLLLHTSRREKDEVEILSGVFEDRTTGAPILCLIENHDFDSSRYESFRTTPRPSHADFTRHFKYHEFADHRGGGRFSGRITAGFVAAGYFARRILGDEVKVKAYVREVGGKSLENDSDIAKRIEELKGDSLGGIVECIAHNLPIGLGEPVFDTVEGEIAKAIFSIPGVKGIEFGAGFAFAEMKGSQANDGFCLREGKVETETNNAGGILGGITNGMPLIFRVVIKPTPSISLPQKSVDLKEMKSKEIRIEGRHDPCIVLRAAPVVEAVACIVLADLYLRHVRGIGFEEERIKRKD